jgi:WD40 repeat protein/serine/threonine protein kinase
MSEPSSVSVRLDALAEDFAQRHHRGERPTIDEYAQRYPELADAIRDLFPALALMQNVMPEPGAATGPFEGSRTGPAILERLGDYRIMREVGRGGMGIVYEAEQESLGRHVALKVLPAHALLDSNRLQRFQREAKAAARLHHTNIVPVFGVGEQAGLHYYVMQFIQGLGLDEVLLELRRLRRPHDPGQFTLDADRPGRTKDESVAQIAQGLLSGSFDPAAPVPVNATVPTLAPGNVAQVSSVSGGNSSIHLPGQSETGSLNESGRQFWQSVARVGVQVASALDYASGQGVLHRDIKPSNLLLDTQGNVWVTDFGLAKGMADADNLTHTGDLIGTLRYMAPERFSGQGDVRSDLYSLGLTLYELLALRPAFNETDRNKLVKRVMHDEPPRPRKVNSAIPRDLETVVLKAIDRDPARRYQTAGEMVDDLKRFLEDRPVRARRASETEKFLRWCRRNPMLAMLMAALLIVFLIGFAGVVWQWRGAEAARKDETTQRNRADGLRQAAEESRSAAEAARERTENTLYHSNIARARLEQQANNTQGAEAILDRCPEERRGWEWHFLKGLSHSDLFTLTGHTGWVYSVAVSPDDRLIASAGGGNPYWNTQSPEAIKPGEVILWDAATGERIRTINGHGNSVSCVVFSPDGTKLATGGPDPDGAPRVWDVATGRELRRVEHQPASLGEGNFPVMNGGHLAWSPDGRRLAISAAEGNVVTIRAIDGGQDVQIYPGRSTIAVPTQGSFPVIGTTQILFSNDGQRLICKHLRDSQCAAIKVWDSLTGKELPPLEGYGAMANGMAISPEGKLLAAADFGSVIKVWDLTSGRLQRTLVGHQDIVLGLAFSPNSVHLASGSGDCTVRVWDINRGDEVRRFRGHLAKVHSVAFSPDGDRVVSGSADGVVKVWDMTYHPEFGQLSSEAFEGQSEGLAFSADDRRLVTIQTTRPATVASFDPATGTILDRRPIPLTSRWLTPAQPACLDQDGRWLAGVTVADRKVAGCYEVATGRRRVLLRGHTEPIWHVTLSDDGKRIATGSVRAPRPNALGEVKVWDAETGKPLLEIAEKGLGISRIALSPHGDLLAVSGMFAPSSEEASSVLRVYAVASGEQIHSTTIDKQAVYGLTFDRDASRLVAAGSTGAILFWDLTSGEKKITDQGPPMAEDIAVSPDGRRLAVAGLSMTKLLDADTGEEILVLRNAAQTPGNTNAYNPRVRWSHDGRMLAVNCDPVYGSISVWSISTDTAESRAARRRAAERRAVINHTHVPKLALHPWGRGLQKLDLDRVRGVELGSAWEYADRGLGFYSFNDEQRARADLERAAARAPYAGLAYCIWGENLYERGRLKEARDNYALGLNLIGGECNGIYIPLTLFAYFDDGALYRRYVKGCLIDYIDQPTRFDASGGMYNVPALLRPDSGIDPKPLLEYSRRLYDGPATKDSFPHWRHGLALFRVGQYQAALDTLDKERSQKKPSSEPCPPELIQVLRSLALARLDQIEASRTALAEADELLIAKPIKEGQPVPGGHMRLMAEVLRREADGLIRGHSSGKPK